VPKAGGQLNDYLLFRGAGIVEGLTEFLPVSSTAHLRIAEALMHISLSSGYWKMYTIVIQLGAIACLPVYFRERIAKFLSTFPRGAARRSHYPDPPLGPHRRRLRSHGNSRFSSDQSDRQTFGELEIMGLALLIGGVAMWIIDAMNAKWETAGQAAPAAAFASGAWKT